MKVSTNTKQQKIRTMHCEKATNWAKENKIAIDEYNKRIKKHGAFSDTFRSF